MYPKFLTVLLLITISFSALAQPGKRKPKIVGQNDVSTSEERSREIVISDLIVEMEEDGPGPGPGPGPGDDDELILYVDNGPNYTSSGNVITPAVDFDGVLTIPVEVHNGDKKSNKYNLQMTVEAENDPPVITGQATLTTQEGQSITITLEDLSVEDPDNTYPTGFTLQVFEGTGYTLSGSTITPDAGVTGILSVDVLVNDGSTNSNTFALQIEVTDVNDPPVITGQQLLVVDEDQSLTFDPSYITVSDDDDSYPGDFTISLSDGSNYTISSNTIIPDANYNGTLTVPVIVNDGNADSDPFNLSIEVNAVNDAPQISGQVALGTSEGQPLTIELSHLTVTDIDNTYPTGFTLSAGSGDNYTLSNNTITPNTGFNGTLTVPVTVSDGSATSNSFSLQISVDAVNDIPVITGQVTLQTEEDVPITITLQNLNVTDADNSYPGDFTLTVSPGTNYTVDEATVTPAAGYNGTLTIPVTVSDGSATSETFNLQVEVDAVNNAPEITAQSSLQTSEEQSITLSLSNLTVNDPDNSYPSGFSLKIYPGDNYSVSGLTITPSANFNGTLTVPVTVNDGSAESAPFNLQITVNSQNDAPLITGQTALTTTEDTPITIQLSNLSVSDLDNVFPTGFLLNVSAGENFSVSGTTVTPATNFSGTLTVPVTVSDGLLLSSLFNLSVEVTPLNDAPQITSQSTLTMAEDEAFTLELAHLTVTDVDNSFPTGFSLTIASGTNYTVAGTSITPAANFTGTLSVPVTVSDGQASSQPFNVQITVEGANDAPSITGQVVLQVNEEQPLIIQLANLTVTDADNTYPQGFSLVVNPGDNYTVSGTTITPAEDFNGAITIPVTVSDGTSSSNLFDLQVTVNPVNDAPKITAQSELSIYKNKTLTLELSHITIADPDNQYPDDFTLTVWKGENYTFFENVITPSVGFTGTLYVPVTVSDGTASSQEFEIKVTVIPPPNTKPVITSQVTLTTYENQPLLLQLSHLVVTDPDNRFPDDFKLTIFEGSNYTLEGNTITPAEDFSGNLQVRVTVSDKETTSDPYVVIVQVLPVADIPLITSQEFLRINEDDSIVLKLTDLVVIDPDNSYPTGFSMTVSPGSNYTVEGFEIKPFKDFNGYLSVPVKVNDGVNNSAPYQVLILVEALNDEPSVAEPESSPLFFVRGKGALKIFEDITISDVDDDSLSLAEIQIDPAIYEPGKDSLIYESGSSIRTAFDRATGLLVLFGKASVAEYESLIRAIEFDYVSDRDPSNPTKRINLTVSDGKVFSRTFTRMVGFEDDLITLDIPSGFTPNGDGANDTWNIKSIQGNDSFSNAIVRVYNKNGVLVFESTGLEREWDGRLNGTLLPPDTYFYTIDLNGSYAKSRYKGLITLLR